MRRLFVAAVIVASIATATPLNATTKVLVPPCDERSWIGGTTEWCDGALVYRDYVYDDTGADTTRVPSPHGTALNRATGDVNHNDHGQALNSADLLTLRLRRNGGLINATFQLNTLFKKDRTIAAISVDIDDNQKTGGGAWGHIDTSSRGWERVYTFTKRSSYSNTIVGSFPVPTKGDVWRIQAVLALNDGTPMNVAFRPSETGDWWEEKQSAALAAGDISVFGYRVSRSAISHGSKHNPAPPRGPGYYERVYKSDYPIREGVNYDGLQMEGVRATYQYLGHHQPYAIYIPKPGKDRWYGMQLALHGRSAAHASLINNPGIRHAFGDLLRSVGDRPRILVVPLARGPETQYVDYAERDVLDVMADVRAHYPVDSDRIFAGGYSMGGQGAYWFSSLYPDMFAGAVNWVGFTADCLNGTPLAQGRQRPEPPAPGLWENEPPGCSGDGNVFDYLESTRHVPMAMVYAAQDELVWANHAVALAQRYDALDYEHILWFHPVAEHLTFGVLDIWTKEALWSAKRTRVRNPARLSYRTNPYFWFAKADLKQDGAYWIDDLVPAKPSRDRLGDISVELTSHRCAPGAGSTADITNDAGVDPVPWVSQEGTPRRGKAIKQGDTISGTVTNASSFEIDVEGACMSRRPITLDIDVDGPTLVRFSDGRPSKLLKP